MWGLKSTFLKKYTQKRFIGVFLVFEFQKCPEKVRNMQEIRVERSKFRPRFRTASQATSTGSNVLSMFWSLLFAEQSSETFIPAEYSLQNTCQHDALRPE